MLARVNIGWQWLQDVINKIVERTNAQKIIPSASVAVQETPSGTILTVQPQADQQQSGQQSGKPNGNAGWQQIMLVDNNCNRYTMKVWGYPPTRL